MDLSWIYMDPFCTLVSIYEKGAIFLPRYCSCFSQLVTEARSSREAESLLGKHCLQLPEVPCSLPWLAIPRHVAVEK